MMKTLVKLFTVVLLLGASPAGAQNTIPKWKVGDLERYMDSTSAPTIINFWATFCKPCIAEIPHFQELAGKYNKMGVRLLLVSLDLPEDYSRIRSFAAKRKITAPMAFLDESNADVFCPRVDSSWSGAIPATLFLNKRIDYRYFKEESLTKPQLEAEIRKMLHPAQ